MNEIYKNNLQLVVQFLNINSIKAAALYDEALTETSGNNYSRQPSTTDGSISYGSASENSGSSTLEYCIHAYYGERESLIGVLEILVNYGNQKRIDDPFPTINRALQEIFDESSSSCVDSLLKIIIKNTRKIEALTPLPTDSTTQVSCI